MNYIIKSFNDKLSHKCFIKLIFEIAFRYNRYEIMEYLLEEFSMPVSYFDEYVQRAFIRNNKKMVKIILKKSKTKPNVFFRKRQFDKKYQINIIKEEYVYEDDDSFSKVIDVFMTIYNKY